MHYFNIPSLVVLFVSSITFAQTASADLSNAVTDIVFLSKNFVAPAADASVYQSSSAWTSSAKSVGKFKVDFAVHFNALPIPKKQRDFDVSNSDFRSLEIRGGATSATIPSALGGDTTTFFDFTIDGDDYELQAFEGVDEDVLVHPYLQATVGLWKETDVTIRYSPKIKIDVSDYQILGGAIKHNISQYFRKSDSIRKGVELAVLASYSKFDLDLFFDEFKLESSDPTSTSEPLATINSIIVDANSWLFQLMASKEVKRFEFIGSLGLTTSQFDYKLGGDQGLFLDIFNSALEVLEETRTGFKGDVGVNYHFKNFYVSSMVTLGKFANCNIALHYRI